MTLIVGCVLVYLIPGVRLATIFWHEAKWDYEHDESDVAPPRLYALAVCSMLWFPLAVFGWVRAWQRVQSGDVGTRRASTDGPGKP